MVDLHRYEGFHAIRLPIRHNKRNLQPELEKPGRHMADPNASTIPETVKDFVDKLTADYTPEQFFNPRKCYSSIVLHNFDIFFRDSRPFKDD